MKTKLLTVCCVAYAAILLYGALVPFDLSSNIDAAVGRLRRERDQWTDGFVNNKRDTAGNLAVFIPLGILTAIRRGQRRAGAPRWTTIAAGAAAAAVVSLTIESLQLWSRTRTPQVVDLVANTAGGLLGGAIGVACAAAPWRRLSRGWRTTWRPRPARAVAALLLLLALDATEPLYPVLRLRSLRHNLDQSQWSLAEGLACHGAAHWLVCRVGVYVVLTALLAAGSVGRTRRRWLRAAAIAVAFALLTEPAKLFVSGRSANIANPAIAACGAALGLALGLALHGRITARAAAALTVVLLAGYIAYWEFAPVPKHSPSPRADDGGSICANPGTATDLRPGERFATETQRTRYVRPIIRILAVATAGTYAFILATGWFRRYPLWEDMLPAAAISGTAGLTIQLLKLLIATNGLAPERLLSFLIAGALGVWLFRATQDRRPESRSEVIPRR